MLLTEKYLVQRYLVHQMVSIGIVLWFLDRRQISQTSVNRSPNLNLSSTLLPTTLVTSCNLTTISTKVLHNNKAGLLTVDWIQIELSRKLNRWFSQSCKSLTPSLCLVDVAVYQVVYKSLKSKHAKYIIQCLWKKTSDIPVYFVDVGCGNGLLVYILLSEGFNGVGVDCRTRAIWNIYPAFVRQHLTETTLDAECCPGFPNATWLIGNHSDELTPWLPILAARSGPSCRIFVLPCCPFGLYGKYNSFLHTTPEIETRCDSNTSADEQSRYRLYLAYLRGLFRVCGLSSEIDVLRIPSTKRICLVGRNLLSTDQTLRLLRITDAVAHEKQAATVPFFVARNNHEPILNCTRVPGDIKHAVCNMIFAKLLELEPDLKHLKSKGLFVSSTGFIKTVDGRWWKPGGHLALNQVAMVLEREQLESMKSQHGGLQTLLRNHHQAFQVVRGFVQIRWLPEKMAKISNVVNDSITQRQSSKQSVESNKRKTKPCWLLHHHPDGCPYPSDNCDFLHD
ncbi:putative tRNA (Uracil-O(2)-)-methyltransferase [Paragonimus heterotremus]|uniref:tRNA (uracil-O(2)-)-methyltransferase n=1 Tax=Paragonimus heterotremus TaxID=100268 RepID=A0A8J4SNF6_9TREM|nr:putative tRNA (Uracil-O(2)-)-methyltransferase [Paragonimus heterotremus]